MGPLEGIKLLEIAGIGPGPFCAMMLSDMGADVIRVDRANRVADEFPENRPMDLLNRGRRSIGVDLKSPEGVETVLRLVEKTDGLLEGFRPGVMERLGLGPDVCLKRNPGFVYGRMTGWGQEGPWSQMAGHDINYISIAGALHPIGHKGERPVPPLNLVGDFGGGGLMLAFGIVCALIERQKSGKGQVIDAAMIDGASVLMTMFHGMTQMGMWVEETGTNLLDTGSHFYDTYECSDGKYISVGAIEPQFYAEMLRLSGLDKEKLPGQMNRMAWDDAKETMAKVFKTKTRDEWAEVFDGSDACVAPVLTMTESREHPQMKTRNGYVEVAGIQHAAPAPRFDRTSAEIQGPPRWPGEDTETVLSDYGFSVEEITSLREKGAVK